MDTTNQRTQVDMSDTMSVKKNWFLKRSDTVNSFSDTCFWIDLTVMKMDAKTRYLEQHASEFLPVTPGDADRRRV